MSERKAGCTWILAALAAIACERERPPPPPPGVDASAADAGEMDARVVPRPDAGTEAPVVDGDLSDAQWERAETAMSDVASDHEGSALTELRALVVDDRLYLSVEGTLAAGHALVLYVDGELEGGAGVSDFGALADTEGALDRMLARPLVVPAGFAADAALGTTLMPRSVVGLDEAAGWRDIATDPAAFRWLAGEDAPLVCSATGCEASIALASLPGSRPREIAVFARIATETGLTNQTLPEDDPDDPARVGAVLTVRDGEERPPDAGIADAGSTDASATGRVVIDGVIDASEWAGALLETNPLTTDGTPFAGNALRTLRALRDAEYLYVAIEGALAGDRAMLLYVDAAIGGPSGITTNTNQLLDATGALDEALSFKNIILHPELAIDFAWGTLDMSRAAPGTDDRMGWREVALNPFVFAATSAPSACSASACETAIALSDLGASPTAPIGLFVRLGAIDAEALSNQTLPLDVDAEAVTVFAELSP